MRNRAVLSWLLVIILAVFYAALYWTEWFTPISKAMFGRSKWFLYGLIYTIAILAGGFRFLIIHRDSPYQRIRTLFVMGVQIILAFIAPIILEALNVKAVSLTYFWPLKIENGYPDILARYSAGWIFYTLAGPLILAPFLTWRFGKRWYCSWFCGCGGLANTAGDPFRHLSSKTLRSWKIERVTIHLTLLFALFTTGIVAMDFIRGPSSSFPEPAYSVRRVYGFLVGAMLAGLVGVGAYPVLGTRIWCRFFCPMAAILGLLQRSISRFRITVNGPLCMQCGLCSKYCEMGIDVRSYAQKSRDIRRASCVGCGMCARVCPRGVLRLETSPRPLATGNRN